MDIQNINTMDNLILEAIQYISKISKKKVTEDSISTYLNNKGAHNIDNKSIIEILKQLQGKGLINQLYRPIDRAITSKASHSTTSQSVISPIAEIMFIDQNHNVYVRNFSGAKVKCMKDDVKPCIRQKNRITLFSMLEQMSLTLSYHQRE